MLQFFELLGQVNARLMKTMFPVIKAENLTVVEMMILMRINKKGPHKTTDLAKDVAVPPSTFTGIIDRLVSRGYLTRVNIPEDRRSVLLEGTQELKELVDRIMSACDERLTEALKELPPEFLEEMTQNLQTLKEHLQKNSGDCGSIGTYHYKVAKHNFDK